PILALHANRQTRFAVAVSYAKVLRNSFVLATDRSHIMFSIDTTTTRRHGKVLGFAGAALLLAMAGQQAVGAPDAHEMDPQAWQVNATAVTTGQAKHTPAYTVTEDTMAAHSMDPQAWNATSNTNVAGSAMALSIPCFTGHIDHGNQQQVEACAN
ncbi:MAG TPA: hypothetical protein VK110_04430, partial [Salinisphaeraceae bacterium]|nr:hypothetical protein [Salinisphaeraceae bacterium]